LILAVNVDLIWFKHCYCLFCVRLCRE